MHPVGSYCTDISRCTVTKTLKKKPVQKFRCVLEETVR